ncbi:MAG: hypothetical protein ACOY81_08050 [Bacillota bacterium]|uniref:hypothetical protein n=1 Tax=Desulfurispora thermophila TaxID=265470 RepID=UPI00037544FB|nr:hypothetical protein [Desulfurispora thermophila]
MLKLLVCLTKPAGASCRHMVYQAMCLQEEFAGQLEVVLDEASAAMITPDLPLRPYYVLGDQVIGKTASLDRLRELIRQKLEGNVVSTIKVSLKTLKDF